MKCFTLAAILALGAIPALGQDSPQYRECSTKATTQISMNLCARDEATRVDDELNFTYTKMLTARDANAAAKLKSMQRAWLTYRDAYVEAMYPAADKQAEYGTMYPMELNLLRATLTRHQIDALHDLENSRDQP